MTDSGDGSYRERAIEHYRRSGEHDTGESLSSERLIEELRIHQIELELQNEDLMRARNDAEQARQAAEAERDRYYQLFHWAPVAYLLVDGQARIKQANESAARLLGMERHELLSRSVTLFLIQTMAPVQWARSNRLARRAPQSPSRCP